MWTPLHKHPSFASMKKRQKIGEQNSEFSSFLSSPKTEKLNCENVYMNGLEIGHASMQGYRAHMEDEHIIDKMNIDGHTIVAVMDGHSGKASAQYCSLELKSKIEGTSHWKEYHKLNEIDRRKQTDLISKALVAAFEKMDEELLMLDTSGLLDDSGCTVVSAIVTPTHVICASVGDSRCVVGSNTSFAVTSLTEDHKPSNPAERERILKAKGFVQDNRVNGELAMSRALGDFRYKRDATLKPQEYLVVCYPDVAIHKRSGKKDEILVVACDGVWDVMSNSESIMYLSEVVLKDSVSAVYAEVAALRSKQSADNDDKKKTNSNTNNSKSKDNNNTKKRPLDNSDAPTTGVSAQEAAESLIDLALADGSTDNISAIVMKFL